MKRRKIIILIGIIAILTATIMIFVNMNHIVIEEGSNYCLYSDRFGKPSYYYEIFDDSNVVFVREK